MNNLFYISLFLLSVFVASFSQILLKKSANKKYDRTIDEYRNKTVLCAYALFMLSTLLTMLAYRGVNLSLGPMLESVGFVYVAIMSRLILKEKITRKQFVAIHLIMFGIIVSILF